MCAKILFFSFIVLGLSCSSLSKNDEALLKQLSNKDKAIALVEKAKALYENEIISNENYAAVQQINELLSLAKSFDLENESLKSLEKKIESKVTKQYDDALSSAKLLQSTGLTKSKDQLKFIRSAETLKKIDPKRKESLEISKSSDDLKAKLLTQKTEDLKKALQNMDSQKNITPSAPIISQVSTLVDDIQDLEPDNQLAKSSEDKIANLLEKLYAQDLQKIRNLVQKENFDDALAGIEKLKNTGQLKASSKTEILNLQYSSYFGQAKQFLEKSKLPEADAKINKAISIKKTSEATALKQKIKDIMSIKDYDAELEKALPQIDERIKSDKLSQAQEIIDDYWDKINAGSKSKLQSRINQINSKMDQLYKKAISLYDDEDFKAALAIFEQVLRVNPKYERIQQYYDKTKSKVRALGGE